MNITEAYQQVFDKLIAIRAINPSFTFWLRKKGEGLNKGYWFQGTNKYISVGLVKEGSGNLSTKSIALHFDFENGKPRGTVILENRFHEKSKFFKFYQELSNELKPSKKDHSWYLPLDNSNGFDSIIENYWKFHPTLIALIKKHKFEKELLIENESFEVSLKKIMEFMTKTSSSNSSKSDKSIPLNQILYGPPGTGKTYNTINKALEIIGDVEVENLDWSDREKVKELFDKKMQEGQIVFSTFHQSMSYEEFIEGIKPIEPKNDDESLTYRVEPGVFKKLSVEASFSIAKSGKSKEVSEALDFSNLYDLFIEEVQEFLITNGKSYELKTKSGSTVFIDSRPLKTINILIVNNII